jgi:hypothetical protein
LFLLLKPVFTKENFIPKFTPILLAAAGGMQRTSWPMTRSHATPLHSLAAHKRDPLGINARGFHEDVFHRDYGSFHPMRRRRSDQLTPREKRAAVIAPTAEHMTEAKRRPEMDAAGFYGDTFSNGLGEFWPLRKRWVPVKSTVDAWRKWYKRKPEMDSSGFFGDTFSNGFGDFWTMKKKNNQDIYKRKPEMDSAGFYGDTFSNGFGDFWTVKKKLEKRRPEMDSAGFYGDTFSNGFGDFWTVKKRSPGDSEKQAEMENVSEASPSVQADESSIQ